MSWYYAQGQQQLGPVSDEEFNRLVQQGTVTNETLVWQEHLPDWVPYGTTRSDAQTGIVCAECGKQFNFDDVIRFGGQHVCAACKPTYVQRMAEGGLSAGPMDYAGFWIRVGARVVDGILLNIVNLGIAFMIGMAMAGGGTPEELLKAQYVAMGVNLLIALVYEVFFIGKFGATPGKMVLKLKVVRADGQPVSYLRAFGRHWATGLSAIIMGIGYLMAGFDREQHRSLHDRICDTRVVRV